ncbi:MAG TPA: hypothetical protein VJB06_03705 [archaeon]|nr:hypothetical protein [archaeon]
MLEKEMEVGGFSVAHKKKIGPKRNGVGGVFVYIFKRSKDTN